MPTTSKNRYNSSSEDSANLLPTYNPQALTGRMRHAYTTEEHEEENHHDLVRHTRNEQSYAELGEHLQWHGIELTPMLSESKHTMTGEKMLIILAATLLCGVFALWAIKAALH